MVMLINKGQTRMHTEVAGREVGLLVCGWPRKDREGGHRANMGHLLGSNGRGRQGQRHSNRRPTLTTHIDQNTPRVTPYLASAIIFPSKLPYHRFTNLPQSSFPSHSQHLISMQRLALATHSGSFTLNSQIVAGTPADRV